MIRELSIFDESLVKSRTKKKKKTKLKSKLKIINCYVFQDICFQDMITLC